MATKKEKKYSKDRGPQDDLDDLKGQIKNMDLPKEERDRLKAKLELGSIMDKRLKRYEGKGLNQIRIQESFDKDPISTRTDVIGDDKLSDKEGSFKKGGLVRSGKPKLAKKGWR